MSMILSLSGKHLKSRSAHIFIFVCLSIHTVLIPDRQHFEFIIGNQHNSRLLTPNENSTLNYQKTDESEGRLDIDNSGGMERTQKKDDGGD